jgi:Cytochrome c7 and related cytochrome c
MFERTFKHAAHLVRMAALFVAGVVVFLGLRALLVPKDFGLYGHYRAGALDDVRARDITFAGHETCEACHSDVAEARTGGKHARIGCEACHGAQARHAGAEDPAAAKPQRPNAQLCLTCHAQNVAKPRGFPQIEPKEHAEPGTCLTCHKAHRPEDLVEGKP